MEDQENIIAELGVLLQQLRDENQALQRLIKAVDRKTSPQGNPVNPSTASKIRKRPLP